MKEKFIFDKNGQISDSDPIYIKLDEWNDDDEYDNILDAVYAIPREQWSNKLWFHVISALNNKKQFNNAREELAKIEKLCKTPRDISKYHYMLGYSFYMEDKELIALDCFEKAVNADKGYTDEIGLQNEIDFCNNNISRDLERLSDTTKTIVNNVSARTEKSSKNIWTPNVNSFPLMLAYLPSVRIVPVLGEPIGIDNLFYKYDDGKKPQVREWLQSFYNVCDTKTLAQAFNKQFNRSAFFNDAANYLSGKPSFDIAELNEDGLFAFTSCVKYCKRIVTYVPDGGIAAWDISERIGLARYAYACDILSSSVYTSTVTGLTDLARKTFSSWKEYVISLILGGGYFIFSIGDFKIDKAIKFMLNISHIILNSNLLDADWNTKK